MLIFNYNSANLHKIIEYILNLQKSINICIFCNTVIKSLEL